MIYACRAALAHSARSRIPLQVRVHSSRTSDVGEDAHDRSTTGTFRRKEGGSVAGTGLLLEKGCARVMLQLGSVYNSADYIPDRERSRHCCEDLKREQSHNEFIDYTTWRSYQFTVNARGEVSIKIKHAFDIYMTETKGTFFTGTVFFAF